MATPHTPANPPRCRRPDESLLEYRVAMGWDAPAPAAEVAPKSNGHAPARHAPMVVAAARVLCARGAALCNVDAEDSWKVHGDGFLEDAAAALYAAGMTELLEAAKKGYFALVCAGGSRADREVEALHNAIGKATGGAW